MVLKVNSCFFLINKEKIMRKKYYKQNSIHGNIALHSELLKIGITNLISFFSFYILKAYTGRYGHVLAINNQLSQRSSRELIMKYQKASSSFTFKFVHPECSLHCSAWQLCLFGLYQADPRNCFKGDAFCVAFDS